MDSDKFFKWTPIWHDPKLAEPLYTVEGLCGYYCSFFLIRQSLHRLSSLQSIMNAATINLTYHSTSTTPLCFPVTQHLQSGILTTTYNAIHNSAQNDITTNLISKYNPDCPPLPGSPDLWYLVHLLPCSPPELLHNSAWILIITNLISKYYPHCPLLPGLLIPSFLVTSSYSLLQDFTLTLPPATSPPTSSQTITQTSPPLRTSDLWLPHHLFPCWPLGLVHNSTPNYITNLVSKYHLIFNFLVTSYHAYLQSFSITLPRVTSSPASSQSTTQTIPSSQDLLIFSFLVTSSHAYPPVLLHNSSPNLISKYYPNHCRFQGPPDLWLPHLLLSLPPGLLHNSPPEKHHQPHLRVLPRLSPPPSICT